MSYCKSCGAPIVWIRMKSGKMMVYGDPRWSEYELQELKYRCWKRKLTKDQWRLLRVRIKNDARTDDDI